MNNELNQTNRYKKKILTIPNVLSFFRLCLIPLFVWMYCVEEKFPETGYILILSGATDVVDGYIARKYQMISDLGKVLDPIADKLTQAAMLFCLCSRFPLMMVPLALMIVKEFYMGITGLLVIKKTGQVFGANWHGKVSTCLLDAMMILHLLWYDIPAAVSNAMIGVCMVMMVISLVLYGIHNHNAIRAAAQESV